ncbi:MAG: hypothetical protein ACR2PR_11615 [Pseudohongiellaceae bacterium]
MTFDPATFALTDCNNSNSGKFETGDDVSQRVLTPRFFTYSSVTAGDNIAAVEAVGYFNDVVRALGILPVIGDVFVTVATDGVTINAVANITSVSGRPVLDAIVTMSTGQTLA